MPKQNTRYFVLTLILSLALTAAAGAFDSIQTASKGRLSGRIVGMDAAKIELQQGPGGKLLQDVPVNEVLAVDYEAEPADLKAAKKQVREGRYAEALAALDRITQPPARPEIRQDVQFYKALCSAGWRWGKPENNRRRTDDEGLRPRQPQELPLSRSLGDGGRPVGGHPPIRPGGRILRPLGKRSLARLQACGLAWTPAARCSARARPARPWPPSTR